MIHLRLRLSMLAAGLLIVGLVLLVPFASAAPTAATAVRPASGPLLFDSFNVEGNFSTVPNTFQGQPFNLGAPGPIAGLDFYMAAGSTQVYQNIAIRVQFWDGFASGSTPVFSSAVGSPIVLQTGPFTTSAGMAYLIHIDTGTVTLTGTNNHGVAINIQADTGAGLISTTQLVPASRGGFFENPPAAGSIPLPDPNYGFYVNQTGRTDFNFIPANLYTLLGKNSALVLRLYGVDNSTATPTSTRTSTPTNTPTSTATRTPTPSSTPSSTPTKTATPTNITFTPTNTATNVPTDIPTTMPSGTITATPSKTPTATLTPSATPSKTPTGTLTPSATPSTTPTGTLTPSATPSTTPTATLTPSATPSTTPTGTPATTPVTLDRRIFVPLLVK